MRPWRGLLRFWARRRARLQASPSLCVLGRERALVAYIAYKNSVAPSFVLQALLRVLNLRWVSIRAVIEHPSTSFCFSTTIFVKDGNTHREACCGAVSTAD